MYARTHTPLPVIRSEVGPGETCQYSESFSRASYSYLRLTPQEHCIDATRPRVHLSLLLTTVVECQIPATKQALNTA